MIDAYPSQLLQTAVDEFGKLPGVGHKTALRLVLHLLRQDPARAEALGESIIRLRREVCYCKVCHNISDNGTCSICSNPRRDHRTVCVVENVKDVMMIESTHQFSGVYHVLGGLISPMDGIGPSQLEIESLVERVRGGEVDEVILALSTTIEGDTTDFYIFRKLAEFSRLKITTLARGVSVGDELEYTDSVTLGRSIQNRTLFTHSFPQK